jgi:microcompartment protein CcmL/EutN
MTLRSLGLIETWGLVAAVEAADAGAKAANVALKGYELARGGLVTVRFEGDVAAVRAAVSAASVAAGKVGRVVSTHVIARPHAQLQRICAERPKPAPLPDVPCFGVPTEAAAGGDAPVSFAEAKDAEQPSEPATAISPADTDPVPPPAEDLPEDMSAADQAGDLPAAEPIPEDLPATDQTGDQPAAGEGDPPAVPEQPPAPPAPPVAKPPSPPRRRSGGRKPGGGEPKKR